MRTRSSSNFPVISSYNPSTSTSKRRNRKRLKQPFILEESPVDTMADQRIMAELLCAPTKGYAEAIMVPSILAEQFELKHSLINMMTMDQGSPSVARKRTLAFYSYLGGSWVARRWQEKEPPRSIHTWEDLDRYKDLLHACPHHGFIELHQLDTFYNALNPADQDSLNAAAGGNLLERRTQDVLTIIENKSKIAKLTHAVNQQTSAVTTAMTAMLKQFQATPPPASVKAVEETCVTCDRSGSLPSNTVANPKSELKAITTRSDERVEETFTDPDLAEYTIKVPPPSVKKYKPPSQREYFVHQRDPLHPNIPYPSRMLNQKQEKDEVQIHKFWQIFKQLHINVTLVDALILMPKYHKMLKALLSNKEKLEELANTPLNKNCSAVILKKLPEKLRDPGKFLIPCGFSELKCKALADLGASINLMPLSVWKKLGLPELISTRMTLKLANRAICTPAGIARDVFVPVGKFTFPADFVIIYYESDPRVLFILGRPFLWTARALIDVHGEEMILRDDDEILILNMRHDTSSYSNQPQRESINLINVFNNLSEDFLEDLFTNKPSSNPTYSFSADELAFPLKYDDDLQFDIESDLKEIEFLLHQDIDSSLKDLIDQSNLANLSDIFVDSMPKMFTDEHALDYSSPSIFDEYDDDFLEIDAENVCDDSFNFNGEKIKESKLLIDELDLPCDFLLFEYDLFIS
nr:reverse transcriptase domain-containing protein [Tanacetum cinerariifolium]